MGFIGRLLSKFSNGPAIQNLENFDMIVEMKDGGIVLPIVSSQYLDDSKEVMDLLITKVNSYIAKIEAEEFKSKYSNYKYIKIELNCIKKPDQIIIHKIEELDKKYQRQNISFTWKK